MAFALEMKAAENRIKLLTWSSLGPLVLSCDIPQPFPLELRHFRAVRSTLAALIRLVLKRCVQTPAPAPTEANGAAPADFSGAGSALNEDDFKLDGAGCDRAVITGRVSLPL